MLSCEVLGVMHPFPQSEQQDPFYKEWKARPGRVGERSPFAGFHGEFPAKEFWARTESYKRGT